MVTIADFRPLPFLGNPHAQTILGNLLKGRAFRLPTRLQRVALPDGDRLVLHDNTPPTWQAGDPIALLIHGLGGCHASGYMLRMTRRLWSCNWRVARLDLRGCGKGMALARRPYHAGCSDDVRAATEAIANWSPRSPLTLIGFSLGGNIALKLAGEAKARPVANLKRVAAVSPPVDLERCAELLALPRNRFYQRYYVQGLLRQVKQRQSLFPEEARIVFPRRATMRQFDELYTAPRCGFHDALHYYRTASSLPLLSDINLPTLILTARDDPFVAVEPLETLKLTSHISVCIATRGGHLGFLGRHEGGGVRWAEHRVWNWVVRAPQHGTQ